MKKRIISFTPGGAKLVSKLNRAFSEAGIEPAEAYTCMSSPADGDCETLQVTPDDFAREGFEKGHALIFVGATGIAVRSVSPYVKDKLSDSPVIVIDETGSFVIPLLSGHAGGANKLADMIASLIGAVPVITTATDVNGAFSADVFASEKRLRIQNRDGIKRVSTKAIEGKPVTISVKDYPPAGPVDIIIADETDRECSLVLSPRRYVIGIGTKKGKDPDEAESFIMSVLSDNGIDIGDVYALSTIDIKENEPAIRSFCDRHRLPLITFEAAVLKRVQGDFSASDFVRETVGVDNVCERAAILAAGPGATLECKKTSQSGVTIALAKRKYN